MNTFIDQVFQLAFGENAIDNGYSEEEVLERLQEMIQEFPRFKGYLDNLYKDIPKATSEQKLFFENIDLLITDFEDNVL